MTTWILPVLTLVIGAVLGAYLTSRREHHAWLREKRLSALNDFLAVAWEVEAVWAGDTAINPRSQKYSDDLFERWRQATIVLQLLSPEWLFKEVGTTKEYGDQILSFAELYWSQALASDAAADDGLPEAPDPDADDEILYTHAQDGEMLNAQLLDLMDAVTAGFGYNQEPFVSTRLRVRQVQQKRRIYGSEDYQRRSI